MTDPIDITAFRRRDDRITTSGQPTEDQFDAIRDLGTLHVINLGLHSHEKALPDEAASVAKRGMVYTHIPVHFDAPTEADFAAFCRALEAIRDRPVHIHCIMNMRVSAFLYRYERDVLGRDGTEARRLLDSVWQPGGVWAAFIGETASTGLSHRGPLTI